MLTKLKNPKLRVYGALILLGIAVVGWPLSALTVAKSEPPFILGLSWLAIIVSSLDVLMTADLRNSQ